MESKRADKLYEMSKLIRQKMVGVTDFCKGKIHWGSSLSCVEILNILYDRYIDENTELIVSKGHAALALYTVMNIHGKLSDECFSHFQENGGIYPEEITLNEQMRIPCSTGSLGLGLPYVVGMALAMKRENTGRRVFVVSGDGECDEGSVWESVMFANQMKIDNVVLIIDYNHLQADGRTDDIIDFGVFEEKFKVFGWAAKTVNGHDYAELVDAIDWICNEGKPGVIIAETIKGKGISFMENDFTWHDRVLDRDWLERAKEEVDEWNESNQ